VARPVRGTALTTWETTHRVLCTNGYQLRYSNECFNRLIWLIDEFGRLTLRPKERVVIENIFEAVLENIADGHIGHHTAGD
jgi:hypothetical protein